MRTRKIRVHANPNNTDPAYWNTVLKRAGLGVDAGRLPKGRGPVGKKCLIHCGGKRRRRR